jgi:hypothetical protein
VHLAAEVVGNAEGVDEEYLVVQEVMPITTMGTVIECMKRKRVRETEVVRQLSDPGRHWAWRKQAQTASESARAVPAGACMQADKRCSSERRCSALRLHVNLLRRRVQERLLAKDVTCPGKDLRKAIERAKAKHTEAENRTQAAVEKEETKGRVRGAFVVFQRTQFADDVINSAPKGAPPMPFPANPQQLLARM